MSYRHYGGGEPQRTSSRHQPYDPYAESDRYGGHQQQIRRDGYEREDSSRSRGRGYGGSAGAPSSVSSSSRQLGYSRNSDGGASFASEAGRYGDAMSSRGRQSSGFPSAMQESNVWKSSMVAVQQRSSSNPKQTVNYLAHQETEMYRPAWGVSQGGGGGSSSRNNQGASYRSGQLAVASPPSGQPVLMMVPQGAGNNVMGYVANPFSVQRQAPVQMIVGSLPATLNPNVFDQHMIGSGHGGQQQYGGSSRQPTGSHRSPGRSNERGGRGFESRRGGGGMRVSSSSRGRRSPPSSSVRRRAPSPPKGVARNAVYRKPININPPNAVAKKRVSDRVDFGDRKKMKTDSPQGKTLSSGSGSGTAGSGSGTTPNSGNSKSAPPGGVKRPTGNQRRRDKRKRDAEAKANAAAAASPKKPATSTPKKVDKPEAKDAEKGSPTKAATVDAEQKDAAATKPDDDVVVIEQEVKVEEEKKRKSKYDDFPSVLLVCKVCQKSMNDGASFESHLSGRAHTALVKIVEERFQKRAEMLMLESKLSEEEIGIELDRQRRAGKSSGNSNKTGNHCKMCDCTYTVNWGTHKISLGHRILKEFLHPVCRHCDSNFVHRMDWLNHLFSLNHLRRISDLKNAGKDTSVHESITQEELFTINLEMNQDDKPANFLTIRNLDWKVPTPSHIKDMLDEGEQEVPEGEIVIPEDHDGTVIVGREAVIATTGFCCKVCRTYMTQEKEVDTHCMSKSHFGMYVSHLKKMIGLQEAKKAAVLKAEEEKLAKEKQNAEKTDETKDEEVTVLDDEGITEVGQSEEAEDAEYQEDEDVEMNGEYNEEDEGEMEGVEEEQEESFADAEDVSFNESGDAEGLNESLLNETIDEETPADGQLKITHEKEEDAGNKVTDPGKEDAGDKVADSGKKDAASDKIADLKNEEDKEAEKKKQAEETEQPKAAEAGAEKVKAAAIEENAEKANLTEQQAEESKIAAEEAEKAKVAAEEAGKANIAAEEAEKARIAAEEAENTKTAAEEAEKVKTAAEEAEKARIVAEEAEKEKASAEKAETEAVDAEKQNAEQSAAIKVSDAEKPEEKRNGENVKIKSESTGDAAAMDKVKIKMEPIDTCTLKVTSAATVAVSANQPKSPTRQAAAAAMRARGAPPGRGQRGVTPRGAGIPHGSAARGAVRGQTAVRSGRGRAPVRRPAGAGRGRGGRGG